MVFNDQLTHHVKEFCKFMGKMKAGYNFCIDLIASSGNHLDFIKSLAPHIKQEKLSWEYYSSSGKRFNHSRKGWRVRSVRHLASTAILLQHCHPGVLSVHFPLGTKVLTEHLNVLLTAVKKENFRGQLELYYKSSLDELMAIDEVVLSLKDAGYVHQILIQTLLSKTFLFLLKFNKRSLRSGNYLKLQCIVLNLCSFRCKMMVFLGCLKSPEAIQVLASLSKISILVISVPDPYNHHLHVLKGRYVGLCEYIFS